MEKIQGTAWMGQKIGWRRASGNHQGGANNVSQVDGVSDMVPSCQLCGSLGEGSEKEQWPLVALCLGESSPTSCHDSIQFFLNVSDAFQSAVLTLYSKGSESE